ncbi:Pra1 family protein f2 [Thalictrum thalictroides]|uniref:PRA1 family protein n=1 Tax=Thalictrum thalictroides TaxID=46969 RepID=A0A7J6VLE8_THATH|nr:Pra1 family protein f2 [Thalictrum thalictroides]
MTTYGTIPISSSEGSDRLKFLSTAKERMRSGLATRRPWREMIVNIHSLNLPSGFYDGLSRIKTNFSYFRMNYAILVLLIVFLSLLWHPISLIVFFVMMLIWLCLYFLRDEPLVIFHRQIGDRVVLVVLSIVTLIALLLTRATGNILISLLVGVVVVGIHAVFRKTDDLFVDEEALGKRPLNEPVSP